jgi:hypothetical protein
MTKKMKAFVVTSLVTLIMALTQIAAAGSCSDQFDKDIGACQASYGGAWYDAGALAMCNVGAGVVYAACAFDMSA